MPHCHGSHLQRQVPIATGRQGMERHRKDPARRANGVGKWDAAACRGYERQSGNGGLEMPRQRYAWHALRE